MKNISNKQKGFSILSVILFMVVIISAFSIWALSGNSNAKGSDDKNKLYASSIINDGAKLKLAFDIVAIKGGKTGKIFMDPSKDITFDKYTTSPYNMYGPETGIKQFDLNNNIFRDDFNDSNVFIYNGSNFKGNVGTSDPDPTIILYNIKDSICKIINQINNGTDILPIFNGNLQEQATNWDYMISYEDIDLSNISETLNWTSGCVNINNIADHSMYFRILKVN